jgi:hypothetical protein
MTENAADIQQLLREHVASEILCAEASGPGTRIECLTPLEYPSGDGISVWVEDYNDRYVVTEYGEALMDLVCRPSQDHKALIDQVLEICAPLGLAYSAGRINVESDRSELGDAVWRCATAASLIAQVSVSFHPRRRQHPEKRFVSEVEHALKDRRVAVEREHRISGASGHKHTATIFVPDHEAVLEPITGHWNQVYAVYSKFGDISRVNGYSLYSLVDDRQGDPDAEMQRMLIQVSDVIAWSRREDWLARLT